MFDEERDRDRETDRQTETARDGNRQTERQTERERESQRESSFQRRWLGYEQHSCLLLQPHTTPLEAATHVDREDAIYKCLAGLPTYRAVC